MYLLISKKEAFMQCAYCIGTKAECLRYALAHGIRTSTELIPF
jgi:hypothetical protein